MPLFGAAFTTEEIHDDRACVVEAMPHWYSSLTNKQTSG